jgi:molybdopterin-binding protein
LLFKLLVEESMTDLIGRARPERKARMKLSARNVFKGKVLDIKVGPIASKVRVDIGGGNVVTSTITADAVDDLGIAAGDEISVIIKSSSVMLGK